MVLSRRRSMLVGAVALLGLGLAACGSEGDREGQASGGRGRGRFGGRQSTAAVPVKVEAVTRQGISEYILANTTLEAFQWVDVRSRTSGQVVEILKEEGDPVAVGSVIVRLDADAARLQVTQMEVDYEDARRVFQRDEKMYERKLVSDEWYENSRTRVDRTHTQFEQAKLNLSYTTIASPVKGVVTIRNVEVGNMVTNNQVVCSVADFDPLLARIRIPEKNIEKIAVGQGARITVESSPGKTFGGRVKMISPVVDPESGTIKVTIEIPEEKTGILRPGMFASVYIITETRENALVIPKKALVLQGEGDQIFVYETNEETGIGRAVRKKIKVGFTDNERLEVLSGLSEGERVITVGQDGLRPGTGVRLVGEAVVASASREEAPAGRPGGGGGGRRGGGGFGRGGFGGGEMSPERLKMMQERMFERFPDLKAEFEKRVKKDPDLATNADKWRAFIGEMREKGVVSFGGWGGGGRGGRGN